MLQRRRPGGGVGELGGGKKGFKWCGAELIVVCAAAKNAAFFYFSPTFPLPSCDAQSSEKKTEERTTQGIVSPEIGGASERSPLGLARGNGRGKV